MRRIEDGLRGIFDKKKRVEKHNNRAALAFFQQIYGMEGADAEKAAQALLGGAVSIDFSEGKPKIFPHVDEEKDSRSEFPINDDESDRD